MRRREKNEDGGRNKDDIREERRGTGKRLLRSFMCVISSVRAILAGKFVMILVLSKSLEILKSCWKA